jgi:pimeloyl-ACP methyl ester carboxylesterase
MTGIEMGWLGKRLADCGFQARRFRYADVRRSPEDNAQRLHQWLDTLPAGPVHFVAHSLGGIVLLHYFSRYREQWPTGGRVVFLGSPVRGSAVARRLVERVGMGRLLGKSIDRGLLGGAPAWDANWRLGVISGSLGFGLGQLLGGLDLPHDGTVSVAETWMPTMSEAISLPVSHFGLLTSASVACAVCRFLDTGSFQKA